MGQAGKRITVGLLVSGITDAFTESICKGVMRAAEEKDVTIVVFPCKYLDRDLTARKEIMYEYQYNTLFSFAGKENVDALMISADSIGCYTSRERMKSRLEQYAGIPCVLLASKIEGYASVTYDNFAGIKEGLEYLIRHKNCRKIGMIGGPDDNSDAYERKQTFLSVLKENGISFSPSCYAEGTLSRYSGRAFRELFDKNPDMQAVFCVNDDTALGVYEELDRRGLVPGKDMYVLGYDNTVQSAKANPSLSSVLADSAKLGEKALDMVLRMLDGETVGNEILPTKFVRRDSFGSRENEQGGFLRLDGESVEEAFHDIFYGCKYESVGGQMEAIHGMFQKMMGEMALFLEPERGREPEGESEPETGQSGQDIKTGADILDSLEEFLRHRVLEYADVERFMTYMEQIYRTAEKTGTGLEKRLKMQELFTAIFRKMVSDMDYRFGRMKDMEEAENFSMKLFVRDILQFERGSDQSYAVLLENLEWLEIRNACVYLFEKPMVHLCGEEFVLPGHMLLKVVLRDGNVQIIPAPRQKKKIAELYGNGDTVFGRTPMVVLPLFSNEVLYGILLCDLTEKLFANGEFLTNQMSSAVRMIDLLKANEKMKQRLEESLVTLRENNIALDNLSKSDGLTGILNRRGFYAAAEEFMKKNREAGKETLFAYIDMNNLKIINDRYGHEEGDFSLKLIGRMLVDAVGDKGIAGRIGGDEFACVMDGKEESTKEFSGEIETRFARFNAASDKEYNVTVSVGAVVLDGTDETGLKEALALADVKLYEAKQHRVKTVAKGVRP